MRRTSAIQNTLKHNAVVIAASLHAVGYSKLSSSSSDVLPGAACSTVSSPMFFSFSMGAVVAGISAEVLRAEGVVDVVPGLTFSEGSFASPTEGAMVVAWESAIEMGRRWPCCSLMGGLVAFVYV